LLNDPKSKSGITNQYSLLLATDWKLPIKAGLVIHFERSVYNLTGGGQALYTAPSLGPQFKSKDFLINDLPFRIQTQLRISPWGRLSAETAEGQLEFDFYTTDCLTSLEHPIGNRFGEFVLGLFFQAQWLNIKNQSEVLNLRPRNNTNKAL